VANCLIFHNLCSLARLVWNSGTWRNVGTWRICHRRRHRPNNPCLTEHSNRFADYTFDLDRKPPNQTMGSP